jgi:hypothetical protein
VEEVLSAKRRATPETTAGVVAFGVLTFVEPALESLADTELMMWFAALDRQFLNEAKVRAGFCFANRNYSSSAF